MKNGTFTSIFRFQHLIITLPHVRCCHMVVTSCQNEVKIVLEVKASEFFENIASMLFFFVANLLVTFCLGGSICVILQTLCCYTMVLLIYLYELG